MPNLAQGSNESLAVKTILDSVAARFEGWFEMKTIICIFDRRKVCRSPFMDLEQTLPAVPAARAPRSTRIRGHGFSQTQLYTEIFEEIHGCK